MARDSFRRRTVHELEQLPIRETRQLEPPLQYLSEETRLEEPPYRYSLIRDTRNPPQPTRVTYREFDGKRWNVIPIYSITYLIEPMERAAIEANARGDRANALLLIHSLLEILMRSDQVAEYRNEDTFAEVAGKFRRRLIERALPGVDADALHRRILAVNQKRNDVVHSHLVRYGLEPTNERLAPAEFEDWHRTYDDTLHAVFEYLSL